MHHLKCHMGDGLPASAKLSGSQPTLPAGGESNAPTSQPPTDTSAQDSAAADPDAGIGSAQLSDGFTSYMKGGDAANQLLKLREWQLEKWGKNFSRHRASFGKSPGVLELSPASGRLHRSSPPVSLRDTTRDRRPSSQNSCHTPRSDSLSVSRSVDSVERFDSSATPHSGYGNISSVDAPDHNICPQSVGKEGSDLGSPAQPVIASCGAQSIPSEQAVSSPLKPKIPVALTAPPNPSMPSPPVQRGSEVLPKNANFLGSVPPESGMSCTVDVNQQPRSVASPSHYVLSAQVAPYGLPPLRNEVQDLQEYSVCGNEFSKLSNQSPMVGDSPIDIESYEETNKLPLLATVDSDEFIADVCSPPKQYHELSPATPQEELLQTHAGDREQPLPLTTNKDHHHLVTVNEEQFQQLTVNREHQSVYVDDHLQPVAMNKECQSLASNEQLHQVTLNKELLQSDSLSSKQQQQVTFHKEVRHSEATSGVSALWVSYPTNSSAPFQTPSEISSKQQQQSTVDGCMQTDSHFSDIQGNLSNRNSLYNYNWSSNCDEHFPTEMDHVSRNASSGNVSLHEGDVTKGMRTNAHSHDCETNAIHCLGYEGQTVQEGDCEGQCSTSADTKPYLHKKFHHDQERKMLPTTGVDQVADVSQYINSFQSVLVRKLNGTLSTAIPMTSNMCSTLTKKPEKEVNQEAQEQQQQHPHQQPQAKEHTCEVCHQKYKNLASFRLHCKEHEKKEDIDSTTENLYKECPKESSEGKGKKESFHCDQCSKVFPKKSNFARHMREVHAIKKSYTCLQCNKAFTSKRHLQEHSGIHKGEKAHQCPHCNHLCYTASGVRTHIYEVHSGLEQRPYCCDICGEKFAKVYGLKRHKQRKHTDQQLMCHVCSKAFSCKEDLNTHSRTHIGVGTLKCDSCNKTFATSWALQRHSKTHQKSKTFTCSICNFTFTRKDSLLSHLSAHSQKKPHVCHCGKRFVKKSQLIGHQDKHSNISKYTCSICNHSFKFRVSLKNHSCKKKENVTID